MKPKPVKIAKSDAGRWSWECRTCQAGEPCTTWRSAIHETNHHLRTHAGFGFRAGPARR